MNFDSMMKKWKQSKIPLITQTSIVYYVNRVSNQRNPVAIVFGKFEKKQKSNIWLNKQNNSCIEIVAKTHLYDLHDDDESVFYGSNSNKYIIHSNNRNGKIGFCGDDPNIYLFDYSSSIVINLKPIFKTPGLPNSKTTECKGYVHLDGITVLVINERNVLVECITGKLNVHCFQIIDYNLELPLSFVNEQQKRELAAKQNNGLELLSKANTAQQSSDYDDIREQLLKFKERLDGYAVIAVQQENLKVAKSWTDLILP